MKSSPSFEKATQSNWALRLCKYFGALFGYPALRVQVVPDAQKTRLASVVLLVKNRGVKNPETVDAVGVPPTASKPFVLSGPGATI